MEINIKDETSVYCGKSKIISLSVNLAVFKKESRTFIYKSSLNLDNIKPIKRKTY